MGEMMDKLTKFSAAYIAGIVDADGCISISRVSIKAGIRYRVHVSITQYRPDDLYAWLEAHFGGYSYTSNRVPRWGISGVDAAGFLRWIYPHLILKREEAEIALTFSNTIGKQGSTVGREAMAVREDAYNRCIAIKKLRYK
jgi:hypothetical protein